MATAWNTSPRRIAILRALMLGDLLCAVPALRAFRAGFPEAEIVLVGLAWARGLASRFDHLVDGFLELPGFPGLPEVAPRIADLPGFLAEAQSRRFDLVAQLHGNGRVTNTIALLLGGRRTAGFYVPGELCPDEELFVPYPDEGHEIHRLLALPEHLGLPIDGERLEFPLRPEDEEELARIAPDLRAGEFACVHPGARSARPWPAERFATVADALAAAGLRVVLTGSDAETEVTRRVSELMRAPALDLAGQTSLGGLAALLAGARVLVSNDTGVSHLAAALRVPSVVVVTTSDPRRWAPLDRGLHRTVVRPDTVEPVVAEADALVAATVSA
jgi:ADP-heptose:LPS heptosyltransferase